MSVILFSGKIVANKTVDFEQVQWLNFTIRAQDHGSPPRIAELPVYLRIVDVNDNNPVFLQPSYQVPNRILANKTAAAQAELKSTVKQKGNIRSAVLSDFATVRYALLTRGVQRLRSQPTLPGKWKTVANDADGRHMNAVPVH